MLAVHSSRSPLNTTIFAYQVCVKESSADRQLQGREKSQMYQYGTTKNQQICTRIFRFFLHDHDLQLLDCNMMEVHKSL